MNNYRSFVGKKTRALLKDASTFVGTLFSVTQSTAWFLDDEVDVFIALEQIVTMEVA